MKKQESFSNEMKKIEVTAKIYHSCTLSDLLMIEKMLEKSKKRKAATFAKVDKVILKSNCGLTPLSDLYATSQAEVALMYGSKAADL